MILELIRLYESEQGTVGALKINKVPFCVTLEPADRLNQISISSIPAQQYDVYRTVSPMFGDCFEVAAVPGRTNILFHAGNTDDNTEGCILLAQHWGKLDGELAVLNSGATYRKFMAMMGGRTLLHLTVKEVY
jgi:hypothetical protein